MTENMNPRSEEDAKTLIDEHLRSRGWNLTDFSKIGKNTLLPQGDLWIISFLIKMVNL